MYDYNYNYNYNNAASDIQSLAGVALVFAVIFWIIMIAAMVLMFISYYKLFKKMGLEGWKGLIPTVNTYLQMEKTGVSQKWLLVLTFGSFIAIIPILGWLALAVAAVYFWILLNVSLAKSFGKESGFAVGLCLLPVVFYPILALGSSNYIGPRPMNDIIFKN